MEIRSEYTQLLLSRENMYRFLGRLYKVEVDHPLLEQMKGLSFNNEKIETEGIMAEGVMDAGIAIEEIVDEEIANEVIMDEDIVHQFSQGSKMLMAYLQNPGLDPLTDLAVDYAKIFLAAGISKGGAAFPYESVYTSPKRLIMQDAWIQVLAIYRDKGLSKEETLDFPEDHIALELEFMAYMCPESQNALAAGDLSAVSLSLMEQLKCLLGFAI